MNNLPPVGSRVSSVCGPGERPGDTPGTVTEIVTDRWGTHAVVQMDDGRTETCHSLTTVGIGWYQLQSGPGKPATCPHGKGFNCPTCWPKQAAPKL